MSNPKTKIEVAARYGAFYGLSTIISMLIFYVLQFNLKSPLPSLISYALLVVFIFNGVKSYREHTLGGYISYGSSLGLGVLISIFGGFLIAGWTTILFSFIDPDIIEKILSSTQEELMRSGLPDAERSDQGHRERLRRDGRLHQVQHGHVGQPVDLLHREGRQDPRDRQASEIGRAHV